MPLRRFLACFIAAGALSAQETAPQTPLTALPYSPSLDLTSMDRSADPCVNFYQYACGGWIQKNPIPADQAVWNVYTKLTEENQRFLWGILEQASSPSAARSAVEKEIGDFFAACMDEAAVEKLGADPLRPRLAEIDKIQSKREIPAYIGREHLTVVGDHMLFGFGSNQDYADSSQEIAFASAGGLGMPDRDYYLKSDAKSVEARTKYLEHVSKIFELIGESPAQASADARTVMEIETAMAKATLTRTDKRDPYKLFHKMTPAQLQKLTPAFDWNAYFQATGAPALKVVNVTEPEYFKAMQALLESRPLTEWKTYLRWHATLDKERYLSAPFVQANFEFFSAYLRGIKEMPPRWKRCVQRVDQELGEALGQVFVEKTFGPDTKQRALLMTKEVELAMEGEIKTLPWMGSTTKERALQKLQLVVNKIGYPDRWRDYSSIPIARNDYFGNVERATSFESRRELAKIGKPVDHGEWQMSPPTVNAYYDPQMNDINFPAGVLQPPLFDVKLDDAPNYGDTGATIGHELTHGFDDEGRQFDGRGNLKDWWTKSDAAEFEKRANCVSEQYGQYTVVDDVKVNSKLTLGEDLADLGGTWLAYLAWKEATKGQQLQPIDGFTPDQRFFIGVAQWACGYQRPESKRANAILDPHSPDEYRVNGVVTNIPEFGEAFSCKLGQPMMRTNPCRVW
jgi:endothelin-converting enzyme/putative endopeptidase